MQKTKIMEEETKKFVQPISLSWTYRNRLVDASTIAIRSKYFSPDSIDIGKKFSNFRENEKQNSKLVFFVTVHIRRKLILRIKNYFV